MKSKRKRRGVVLIIIGVLLFCVAGGWFVANLKEDYDAGKASALLLKEVEKHQSKKNKSPVIFAMGDAFCGTVKIEKLGVNLPVFNEWNDSRLKQAPCRYSGSVENKDMIIVAHNYRSHFGALGNLQSEDEIIFTDAFGKKHIYVVNKVTQLEKTDVDNMKAGKWDFTLFTCTTSREHRVTVRCFEKSGGK